MIQPVSQYAQAVIQPAATAGLKGSGPKRQSGEIAVRAIKRWER